MTQLRLIAAGGTFDKRYNPLNGALIFTVTHVHAIVQRCRFNSQPTITELPLLDSLDMQDTDRQRVLDACHASAEHAVVIIHGTDTMPDTARLLGAATLDKTIVITGAMVPYDVAGSDALFNLGFACAAAQTLAAGVYVVMGGQVFDWQTVSKNRELGRFEARR